MHAQFYDMMSKKEIVKFDNFEWIDITNPSEDDLTQIAADYRLDILQLKDSIQEGHLPKIEREENYNFLILRAYTGDSKKTLTSIKQLSNKIAFFYNDKVMVTIHRHNLEYLKIDPTKKFINIERFLFFVIKRMLETYDEPIQQLNDRSDRMEEIVFLNRNGRISQKELYYLKTEARITKKLLQITQGVLMQMEPKGAKSAFHDVKDKLLGLQLSYDEIIDDFSNILNTNISLHSQKSNEVMKLLTIFSAFFLPLTFIAGIYGMNFKYMPELEHRNAYFICLGFMAVVCIIIYGWFKRKRIL